MEWGCLELLKPHLDAGEGSLGIQVNVSHGSDGAGAGGLGRQRLHCRSMARRISFKVTAHDGVRWSAPGRMTGWSCRGSGSWGWSTPRRRRLVLRRSRCRGAWREREVCEGGSGQGDGRRGVPAARRRRRGKIPKAETEIRPFNINFGPQHPAAHGVLRLVLELDGEVVERVDPHIGLLHRGTEKLIEAQDLPAGHAVLRPARLCRADEPGARLLPGDREAARHRGAARARSCIRVLYLEIGRLLVASAQRHDAGDGRRRADPAAVGLRGAREADGVLRARLGQRACTPTISAPGGVHQDLPPQLVDDIATWCDPFLKVLDDIEGLLTENRIFKQRNVDIGVVSPPKRPSLGLLGRDGARLGRRLGPAQVAALRVLRRTRFRDSDRQERRLLRPLCLPHGRDARVDQDHASSASTS